VFTQCEQPTAQVLGKMMGYTDLSRDGALDGAPPTFTFPRGAAVGGSAQKNSYIGKVTNSWLLGGPKYIQYRKPPSSVRHACLSKCQLDGRFTRAWSELSVAIVVFYCCWLQVLFVSTRRKWAV
jgi:hypothetical protein